MAIVPHDLVVEEILSKLPAKSVLRFKCVSRSWYVSISNPLFVKSHLRQSYNNQLFVLDCLGLPIPQVLKSTFNSLNCESYRIMSTCDGLILLELFCSKTPDSLLMICNPWTRETRQLPIAPVSCSSSLFRCKFGFGYDSSAEDHKIVLFSEDNNYVMSLKSNTWRPLKSCNKKINGIYWPAGIYLNEAIHWGSKYESKFKVFAFSLVDEKFFELPGLELKWSSSLCMYNVSTVYKDCICVYRYYASGFDLWIMKEYGNPTSWSKRRIDLSSDIERVLVFPIFQAKFKIWVCRGNAKSESDLNIAELMVYYDLEERDVMEIQIQVLEEFKSVLLSTFLLQETLVSPNP